MEKSVEGSVVQDQIGCIGALLLEKDGKGIAEGQSKDDEMLEELSDEDW